MILIGVGANLVSPRHGAPQATCEAALAALSEAGVVMVKRSRWYRSAPQPPSDQPWYVNGVARAETGLDPKALLQLLLDTELRLGRRRGRVNGPRIIDLDLLAYDEFVLDETGPDLVLPHPRLAERAFVLKPLVDVAPRWRHPVSRCDLAAMIASLPEDQPCEPIA